MRDVLERAVQILSEALSRTSDYAPLVLFLGSLIEYVFPPFPGDTLVLLGAWYAVHGELSWPLTFLSVTAGAVAGAWIDYQVGAALGRRLDRSAARRGGITADRLHRVEQGYRRYGAWFLVANRFLPGVRAFLFVAAGASGMPMGRVLLYGGISAAVWNALLLVAGAFLVRNLDEMVQLLERYTDAAWAVIAAVAVVLVVRALWLRRARNEGRR
jgi:membrane protein DedA with SNARE-associated domain